MATNMWNDSNKAKLWNYEIKVFNQSSISESAQASDDNKPVDWAILVRHLLQRIFLSNIHYIWQYWWDMKYMLTENDDAHVWFYQFLGAF